MYNNTVNESELKEKTICINRVCKTVKGGRIYNFAALCVVGDKRGKIGVGYGKAKDISPAIQKSLSIAKRNFINIFFSKYTTINHPIKIYSNGTYVYMLPAKEGTGLIANKTIRFILEVLGIRNVVAKTYGSTNPINVSRAVCIGLLNMHPFTYIYKKRGKFSYINQKRKTYA